MDISTEIAHLMKYGSTEEIKALANASTGRIANAYSWAFIANEYARVWENG